MPKGVYERTPEMKTGKYKRTPEHNAANSKAHTGVPRPPRTPEHCAAISDAHTGVSHSPEHIAAGLKGREEAGIYEAMRGGNDIVDHHVAYDFGRLKALTVKITRSFHGQIHHPKGCKFGTYGYSLID